MPNKENVSKARFYNPPNILKEKVGSGGLARNILEQAQKLLEENDIDFEPIAMTYMDALRRGLDHAYNPSPHTTRFELMEGLIHPIMQLKANGGMFDYPLVSRIADKMIELIEGATEPNEDLQEIIQAFHTTITAILHSKLKGTGGVKGDNLYYAICDACDRYFKKHKREHPYYG